MKEKLNHIGKKKEETMQLQKQKIDGLEGVVLESDIYRMLFLPEVGAKMASLIWKETGDEYMSQNPDRPYRRPNYGDAFEDFDISGFDECFPNIASGPYPDFPWQGIPLPDHGEIWTIPWNWEVSDGELHLWCHGVRFAYRFDKWVSCVDQDIHLNYQVTNHAPYALKCAWSAHPLFVAKPNMRVLLPDGTRVRVDWSKGFRLGPLCTEHAWPKTVDSNGDEVDLSTIMSGEVGFADKLYTTKLKEGWCALHDPQAGNFVAFGFSPHQIPYVGVWLNQGGWPLEGKPSFNMALEPCMGYPDRLDIAALRNELCEIPAAGTLKWRLKLRAGRTDDIMAVIRVLAD
jgi:hypothetical protein